MNVYFNIIIHYLIKLFWIY